jgi:O-antigen ligase
MRQRATTSIGVMAHLSRFWPFLLVGPVVLLVRFPGWPQDLASWLWVIVGAAMLIQLAIRPILMRRNQKMVLVAVMLAGFLTWSVLSLVWSPEFASGLRFVGLVGTAFIAYLLGSAKGPPTPGLAVWFAGAVGLGFAVAGLLLIPQPEPYNALNPDRILAMGVIASMVALWYGPQKRWFTALAGLAGLAIAVASGSRTATLVALILLAAAPGLRLPRPGRTLVAVALLTVVGIATTTEGFQERWFESGEGTFIDFVTLQDINSSGRIQVWQSVASSCGLTVLGNGAGAADGFAEAVNPAFPEPHNEYLRVGCDTGLVGSLLLWGALIWLATNAATALRKRTGPRWAHHAGLQLTFALALLAATDNPLTTTVAFLIPAALAMGWSSHSQLETGNPRGQSARRQVDKRPSRGRHLK